MTQATVRLENAGSGLYRWNRYSVRKVGSSWEIRWAISWTSERIGDCRYLTEAGPIILRHYEETQK